MYVLDSKILNKNQLYRSVGEKLGVTICRAEPPRQEDLDKWGAFELQPDQPPTADVVTAANTAEQREDGLWYRVYEARGFTADEIKQHKTQAVIQINDHFERLVRAQAAEYPDSETKTWPQQEADARARVADSTAPTPHLDVLLANRYGQAPTDELRKAFAEHVVSKADAYRDLALAAAGKRQAYAEQIWAATTRADIDAIVATAMNET